MAPEQDLADSTRTDRHVGLVVDSQREFDELVRPLFFDGQRSGEKLVVFGSGQQFHAGEISHNERWPANGVETELRREVEAARRQGYRGVRVLADMCDIGMTPLSTRDLIAFELALDRTVNDLDATMLCFYRNHMFAPDAVAAAMSAHAQGYGANSGDLGFRMWSDAAGGWHVCGAVDLTNVTSFRAALQSAASESSVLRLSFAELRFLDLTGLQVIADLVESAPGMSLQVESSSHSFRRCWEMLGYDETCPRAEIVA
ncbi:MEDS domain-containing protein [Actinophytocola oryzae]|uniref:STAS domain-containing protein n=1 Tax=Actinophytocola oryzae TaxID=502181 RepID=A0A4R7VFC2_9PSEU|nr:MEDS domain-containing protein [Actinophytocola oryzae]TDV47940.1 STAS domain-containing protein [Actinophytocola oryzae]